MTELELRGVTVRRGEPTVCRDVSLSVPAGEITVLFGANGAGKTTLLDGIAGVLPVSGEVVLDGERIDRLPMHRRVARGLAYVEQGHSLFSRLTVAQNLAVVDRSRETLERAFVLFPRLAGKHDVRAGLLSGGEQQMLMVARALATRPVSARRRTLPGSRAAGRHGAGRDAGEAGRRWSGRAARRAVRRDRARGRADGPHHAARAHRELCSVPRAERESGCTGLLPAALRLSRLSFVVFRFPLPFTLDTISCRCCMIME